MSYLSAFLNYFISLSSKYAQPRKSPVSIIPTDNHEPLHETINRFISKGVHQIKMIPTESPSVVVWSKTRKCLVGGKDQPEALEVFDDGSGNLRATYENNIFISLQNRSELTDSDVKEINESEGIIVTNATYGKPYFRYGFIPSEKI